MTQPVPHRTEALDSIDRRIVAELSRDGRLSVRTLAERVHISRTAAHNRLQQLQQRGVITGFGANSTSRFEPRPSAVIVTSPTSPLGATDTITVVSLAMTMATAD